jgi:predicted cupin superfamily sugar epimerase
MLDGFLVWLVLELLVPGFDFQNWELELELELELEPVPDFFGIGF